MRPRHLFTTCAASVAFAAIQLVAANAAPAGTTVDTLGETSPTAVAFQIPATQTGLPQLATKVAGICLRC